MKFTDKMAGWIKRNELIRIGTDNLNVFRVDEIDTDYASKRVILTLDDGSSLFMAMSTWLPIYVQGN